MKRLRNRLLIFLKPSKPRYTPAIVSLTDLLSVAFTVMIIISLVHSLYRKTIKKPCLWITSPHGKHYKLPLYQAIRILRKQKDWQPAEVEPILTKWQMVKRILGK